MANVRRIFPGGNTAEGFYSFHDNIIGSDRNMLYILKGMSGGGKSSMMKEIGKRAYEKGYSVELHLNRGFLNTKAISRITTYFVS